MSWQNEALPIFLNMIVPEFVAVIMSVTLVLIFGEIIPSAVFTGPKKLTICELTLEFACHPANPPHSGGRWHSRQLALACQGPDRAVLRVGLAHFKAAGLVPGRRARLHTLPPGRAFRVHQGIFLRTTAHVAGADFVDVSGRCMPPMRQVTSVHTRRP